MPTNLLLLPLIGGYWFLHVFYYTRFQSQRLDGYRLLVESAFAGVALVAAARIIILLAGSCTRLQSIWLRVAPTNVDYLGTATGSLLLGLVTPHLLNLILARSRVMTAADAKTKAIERHGNHLLRLLHEASLEEKPVSVSLDIRIVG